VWAATLVALCVALVLGGPIAAARADGDPASDVLVAAPPLFLSADSGATITEESALVRQLREAARRGHRLRVAIISTRSDLGSVTALWGQPETYAEFLGRELSLQYRGQLLVVMPAGFAVSRAGTPLRTALTGLAPRHGELLTATEQAIQRLTGVAPATVRAVAVAATPSPASGDGWWATTAVALALVVAAWTASLRRRPPRPLAPAVVRRARGH
jgi:hypothetical protein